jgi:hypothetical protein
MAQFLIRKEGLCISFSQQPTDYIEKDGSFDVRTSGLGTSESADPYFVKLYLSYWTLGLVKNIPRRCGVSSICKVRKAWTSIYC